ncbi:hypothetical protein PV08_01550 [Exophiala spinifera]|uniref:Increased recombination centers protein 6 n=1 Tax=Exophiala spinifera TaxID=91928 RepID=A0A0D1Z090_9EURO|nr:uncharacterized protein PV08_01550 [Exophiala spinifera]KIW20971.1 hypothetical protein PV08_01550 [Exophiala spinifera]
MADGQVSQSSLRLLVLAPALDAKSKPPFPSLLHALTGVRPSDEVASFSGYTSHPPLSLRTKYYSTDISIWCDELPREDVSEPKSSSTSNSDSIDPPQPPTSNGASDSGQGPSGAGKEPADDGDGDGDGDADTVTTPTLEDWTKQMLSPAASEVRAVIGGIILILPVSASSSLRQQQVVVPQSHVRLVEAIHSVREAIEDESYHGELASIVVVQPSSPNVMTPAKLAEISDHLEEVCLSEKGILGWDFVSWSGEVPSSSSSSPAGSSERNEYGEKTGIDRAIEVLEGVDWSASPFFSHDDDDDDDDDDEGFDIDDDLDGETAGGVSMASVLRNARRSGLDYELQREMMELKISLDDVDGDDDDDDDDDAEDASKGNSGQRNANGTGDDVDDADENIQVEQLQGLMERVVAIRDAGSELSPAERGRFARREINRIMREMG